MRSGSRLAAPSSGCSILAGCRLCSSAWASVRGWYTMRTRPARWKTVRCSPAGRAPGAEAGRQAEWVCIHIALINYSIQSLTTRHDVVPFTAEHRTAQGDQTRADGGRDCATRRLRLQLDHKLVHNPIRARQNAPVRQGRCRAGLWRRKGARGEVQREQGRHWQVSSAAAYAARAVQLLTHWPGLADGRGCCALLGALFISAGGVCSSCARDGASHASCRPPEGSHAARPAEAAAAAQPCTAVTQQHLWGCLGLSSLLLPSPALPRAPRAVYGAVTAPSLRQDEPSTAPSSPPRLRPPCTLPLTKPPPNLSAKVAPSRRCSKPRPRPRARRWR